MIKLFVLYKIFQCLKNRGEKESWIVSESNVRILSRIFGVRVELKIQFLVRLHYA